MIKEHGAAAVQAVANMEAHIAELTSFNSLRILSGLYTDEARSSVLSTMRDPDVTMKSFVDSVNSAIFRMWAEWHWSMEMPEEEDPKIDPEIRMCPPLLPCLCDCMLH